jgi:hypothetical protein
MITSPPTIVLALAPLQAGSTFAGVAEHYVSDAGCPLPALAAAKNRRCRQYLHRAAPHTLLRAPARRGDGSGLRAR